jgi:hypothetical protein
MSAQIFNPFLVDFLVVSFLSSFYIESLIPCCMNNKHIFCPMCLLSLNSVVVSCAELLCAMEAHLPLSVFLLFLVLWGFSWKALPIPRSWSRGNPMFCRSHLIVSVWCLPLFKEVVCLGRRAWDYVWQSLESGNLDVTTALLLAGCVAMNKWIHLSILTSASSLKWIWN